MGYSSPRSFPIMKFVVRRDKSRLRSLLLLSWTRLRLESLPFCWILTGEDFFWIGAWLGLLTTLTFLTCFLKILHFTTLVGPGVSLSLEVEESSPLANSCLTGGRMGGRSLIVFSLVYIEAKLLTIVWDSVWLCILLMWIGAKGLTSRVLAFTSTSLRGWLPLISELFP